jgi:hypothetical protein
MYLLRLPEEKVELVDIGGRDPKQSAHGECGADRDVTDPVVLCEAGTHELFVADL